MIFQKIAGVFFLAITAWFSLVIFGNNNFDNFTLFNIYNLFLILTFILGIILLKSSKRNNNDTRQPLITKSFLKILATGLIVAVLFYYFFEYLTGFDIIEDFFFMLIMPFLPVLMLGILLMAVALSLIRNSRKMK